MDKEHILKELVVPDGCDYMDIHYHDYNHDLIASQTIFRKKTPNEILMDKMAERIAQLSDEDIERIGAILNWEEL